MIKHKTGINSYNFNFINVKKPKIFPQTAQKLKYNIITAMMPRRMALIFSF
jgi:hypothetical protein